jgi:hypothetical protein|tara:strand:+ start:1656 stop:1871 length:216 start_codon:yes stop_codon:yes gene_type:complete
MNELVQHLKNQQTHWLDILNNEYKTDTGNSIEQYAKGRLAAYTELLNIIKSIEEENGRTPKEEKRVRSQVQ